jgi:cell division protein FtsA
MTELGIIDIGSYRIATSIVKFSGDGRYNVMASKMTPSIGISGGVISDMIAASDSIASCIDATENKLDSNFEDFYIGLSGSYIESKSIEVRLQLSGRQVSDKEIAAITARAETEFSSEEQKVIHAIPLYYTLDGIENIKNPINMFANELKARLHIITVKTNTLKNISLLCQSHHINIVGFIANGYAAAIAATNEESRKLGSVVIDIGHNITNIAIFEEGKFVYFSSVPFGGSIINKDIAILMNMPLSLADKLKIMHGSCQLTKTMMDEFIEYSGENIGSKMHRSEFPYIINQNQDNIISYGKLTQVINARMGEILEHIYGKIASEYKDISMLKLVLTGGGSGLAGIGGLASQIFRVSSIEVCPMKNTQPLSNDSLAATNGIIQIKNYADIATNALTLRKKANKTKKTFLSKLFNKEQNGDRH